MRRGEERRGKETNVDMWLLTVRRGRAGGLERTRRMRVWALWTEVVLKIVATIFAKPPTPINTTFLGIPPKCFARPAHSIFPPNPIPTLHSSLLLLLNCCFAFLGNKQANAFTHSASTSFTYLFCHAGPNTPNHYIIIIAVSNNQLLKLFFFFWDVINKCNLATISTRITRVMILMRFSVFSLHTFDMK